MKVKAVIFDLFETLVDFSFEEYNAAVAAIAACIGADEGMFVRAWHEEWPKLEEGRFLRPEDFILHISSFFNVVPDSASLAEAVRIHADFERNVLVLRDDAAGALKMLKEMGVSTGMVTNCAIETPSFWHDSPFAGLIDVPVFSTVEKIRKPDPELFRRCAGRLDISPAECIFVGDGANSELSAAVSAGMIPVLFCGNGGSRLKLSGWSGLAAGSLTEIPAMLAASLKIF
jgi:putative hydrolase of the HAD superfamily